MIIPATTLHGMVFEQADSAPDNIAVISGDEMVTYGELTSTALAWAAALNQSTAGRPINVGILSQRNVLACTAILAVLAAGMTYVPINIGHPLPLLADIVGAAGLDALIVGPESIAIAEMLLQNLRTPVILLPDGEPEELRRLGATVLAGRELEQSGREPASVMSGQNAYLLFTSGSTGRPKGVPIPHKAIVRFLQHAQDVYRITPDDRLTQLFDHSFDLSLFDLFLAWRHGAAAVLLDPNAADLIGQVNEYGVTVWFSVPSVAANLRRSDTLRHAALPKLRYSLFCGEPLYADVAEAWRKAAPNSLLENLYGPTELTVACARYRYPASGTVDDAIVPIGCVFPHLPWVVTDEQGRMVAEGELGELCIGGIQMFEGYWRAEKLNHGRFHRQPDGTRLYRTGDLVAAKGGLLHFAGRNDSQVKLNGHRIELSQIEVALRRAGAENAVAIAWPSAEHPKAIRAVVTGPISEQDLVKAVSELLPRSMVPADIRRVATIPLNTNGKLDRAKARRLLLPLPSDRRDVDSVIAEILDIPRDAIHDELAIFSIRPWDSLGHVRLMLALEEFLETPLKRDIVDRIRTVADIRAYAAGRPIPEQQTASSVVVERGLVGVIMDRTAISHIDGNNGRLAYRGYAVEELCDHVSFEEVAHLLIEGSLPPARQLRHVTEMLSSAQYLPNDLLPLVRQTLSLPPLKSLAIAAAAIQADDPFVLVGRLAAIVGARQSMRLSEDFRPIHELKHHERIFHYVLMRSPSTLESEFLRQDLILHAEHGANASTLALRTAVSTGLGLSEAVSSAILTFSGPLHGGAVEGVAAAFDIIRRPSDAQDFVATHRRVMGFGHRVYRSEDPRAARLKRLVEKLAAERGMYRELDIANSLMAAMSSRSEKGVAVNIDLFAAVGYRILGIEDNLGAAVAVLGRVAGWCAHAREQTESNILIRPDLLYDGPAARPVHPNAHDR